MTVHFAHRDIDRLEQSRGVQSRWSEGLDAGLLGGVAARATIDGSWGCWVGDTDPDCDANELLTIAWGGLRGLVGLGVGSLIRYEAWESIPVGNEMVGMGLFSSPRPGPEGRDLLFGARVQC